jgi:hypothetical protein
MDRLLTTLAGIASLAIASFAMPAAARPGPATDIASGDYGGELLVGVDPASHVVSGYFQSSTGGGLFNCIFYFSGKGGGSDIPIRSYFPETPNEVIAGQLVKEASGGFQLRLVSEHGGCGNVQHFADKDQPAEYTLATAYPWISVTVVKSAKAYFFDTPLSKAPRKAYVVKGDGLGVRAVRPGWLQVDYTGSDKPITGWIRSSDVYTLR